jgi:hypothetical protein
MRWADLAMRHAMGYASQAIRQTKERMIHPLF